MVQHVLDFAQCFGLCCLMFLGALLTVLIAMTIFRLIGEERAIADAPPELVKLRIGEPRG